MSGRTLWQTIVFAWSPHLTLTLSPPIGWERRGDTKRTSSLIRR